MKKKKWIIFLSALLAGHVSFAFAQYEPGSRNPGNAPGGCYICGTLDFVYFEGADWFGILAEDACPLQQHMGNPARRQALCNKIKEQRKIKSWEVSCPGFAPYCNSEEPYKEPPEDLPPAQPPGRGTAPPADSDTDGLGEGFGGLPPATRPQQRLVYLVPGSPGGENAGKAFQVWLDRSGCAVPLAETNYPLRPDKVKYFLKGRLVRGKNLVRLEAEASKFEKNKILGTANAEAPGEDSQAVATAARTLAERLKLSCIRK